MRGNSRFIITKNGRTKQLLLLLLQLLLQYWIFIIICWIFFTVGLSNGLGIVKSVCLCVCVCVCVCVYVCVCVCVCVIRVTQNRSSHWRCSVKKGLLRNFARFKRKHVCQRLFFNKVAGLRAGRLLLAKDDK